MRDAITTFLSTAITTASITVGILPAAPASAQDIPGHDLAFADVTITSVIDRDAFQEIYFEYTLVNLGAAPVNLGGFNPDTFQDNVGIQTYLADSPDLHTGARASGGTAIFDPAVVEAGGFFSSNSYANTIQLDDPEEFNGYRWLVVDLIGTGEQAPVSDNNRIIVPIPLPCNGADRATPIGQLDLADVAVFAERFMHADETADMNNDSILDLNDVLRFIEIFQSGCGGPL